MKSERVGAYMVLGVVGAVVGSGISWQNALVMAGAGVVSAELVHDHAIQVGLAFEKGRNKLTSLIHKPLR